MKTLNKIWAKIVENCFAGLDEEVSNCRKGSEGYGVLFTRRFNQFGEV